jgi:hypothetical protein
MTKQTNKTKEDIANTLAGKKKRFLVTWVEQSDMSAVIIAKDEDEAEEIWRYGDYDADTDDVDICDDSLEIEEQGWEDD